MAERAAAIAGVAGEPGPVPFATDAGYLTPAYGGPPTVIIGPGETEQAHKTDEWCSLTRIDQATELYADLAAAWCRGRGPGRRRDRRRPAGLMAAEVLARPGAR